MTARTDDLFVRYMKAFSDSIEHTTGCPACQANQPCAAGQPVHERLARLQDAYIARQQHRN
ncbi:hypothetical protein ACFYXM_34140 [Streptomyces sp. NPDC002476]|uniref:hypothetical protein n=1 Tax=Streptomyces sp. NPDC002476 TaxID=3364648 RepID=UPI0036894CDB